MFHPQFWRNATGRLVNAPRARVPGNHAFSTQQTHQYHSSLQRVRALGPTLWVFAAAGTIYLGCAAFEVHQDVQEFKKYPSLGPLTYASLDAARTSVGRHNSPATKNFSFMDVFTTPWSNLNSSEKMITTASALNLGIFAATWKSPRAFLTFAHIPINSRKYTLFTSMFGHGGSLHLSLNMYALFSFGPQLAGSPTIESSGSHLTAFYLSSGLIASLAYHLTTIWPNKMSRFSPALGASGAIYAMLGAWAMNYPNQHIGIIFIPGSLPAEQALWGIFAFELWGTFVGFGQYLRWAHAAHLGGLGVGMAYVVYDGKNRMWRPTKRFAFNQMRRLKMI